jgi:hypothetical protein
MLSVADYWPDQPGAAGPAEPAADSRPSRPDSPPPIESPEAAGQKRARLTLGGAVALALLLVVGGVLAMFVKQAQSSPAPAAAPAASPAVSAASPVPTGAATVAPAPAAKSAPPLPAVPPPAGAGTTPAPVLPAEATFEVAASAKSVTVRSQDLGTELYRVTLAKGDGPVTAKIGDTGGNHRLTLVKDSKTAAPPITITLNAGVRWRLTLTAGNTETTVNLTQSRLASLELAGGAHVFDLALPRASGTLPVRVTHGMNQLKIKTNGVPVRVTVRDGAGKVILDGDTHNGIKPGQAFTTNGWSGATDRVDVDAVEGIGTLTADTD